MVLDNSFFLFFFDYLINVLEMTIKFEKIPPENI